MAADNIIVLDKGNFDAVTSMKDRVVLVDFWAQWCGPCRAVTPILEKLAGEYGDKIIVGKLNIDDQQELAIRHGIMSIPTIKFYKNGVEADVIVGLKQYQHFKAAVDRLL